ncbi:hypothetical protein PG994_004055 [Apiospora phragmitis]|uniref:Uncharacterized protein n=1 Tax=Apiospora phragmitis TaxID=2905665 RepID=A0ABR1W000_9PEZI
MAHLCNQLEQLVRNKEALFEQESAILDMGVEVAEASVAEAHMRANSSYWTHIYGWAQTEVKIATMRQALENANRELDAAKNALRRHPKPGHEPRYELAGLHAMLDTMRLGPARFYWLLRSHAMFASLLQQHSLAIRQQQESQSGQTGRHDQDQRDMNSASLQE